MKIDTDAKKIEELLTRGAEEVIELESLRKKLFSGKRLRVKFGIDPTGSQLHIGHAVPLRKLKQFQDLGHQVILLIGDYTAMIGDPSGRNETRPVLSHDDVKKNMKTYIDQAAKIIDVKNLEIRRNSEWYSKPSFTQLLMDLTSKITVARILERDDFQKRMKEGSDIQMQEIMYPLLQGYDSVALEADVEIGGTDQKFNLLMGRKLQKKYNQSEQDILTVPILEGVDGEKKMGKSHGNYIALEDLPEEIFGKVMSIPDKLIIKYFELATEVSMEEIKKYEAEMQSGKNPRDYKMKLAQEMVRIYYSEKEAQKAQDYFISTFSKKETPDEMPDIKPSVYDIVTVLVESKVCASKSEARRAIEQKGVKINDKKVESIDEHAKPGDVVQKGSRFFVKVK
ncbi:MAG: tyrosine--tRNA ligase [Candidatus Magasanikbacteria bacterium CG10_big_fil_rev_8_21_14_0_10_36_32]|uniref:Tyrosine--tRNA ligase n=1 Tax=Candidatus Magasanikbacteria bacterium CG10_big_fil_rev_8_21_14_0_10_36_32 TaxID=1974646 RepID=A0A2M6W6A3_9BACT|nr:MAG: tyrosine--tRNA ligase [Candidatus Magasanikbacteria bacterium CG10_big_fil_rev_8_21_14_0_10_36_32]